MDAKKENGLPPQQMNAASPGQALQATNNVLQAQFAKVGQLLFQIDVMGQQLRAFEQENNQLKEEIAALKSKGDDPQ